MAKDVILNKLDNLRRCVERVEKKSPDDVTELIEDIDIQDIIILNLERAVQLSVDIGIQIIGELNLPIPTKMADTFRILSAKKIIEAGNGENLARAVGFRNTAVHAYQEIDWNIVFSISHRHLEDFRRFAKSILDYIENTNTQNPLRNSNHDS